MRWYVVGWMDSDTKYYRNSRNQTKTCGVSKKNVCKEKEKKKKDVKQKETAVSSNTINTCLSGTFVFIYTGRICKCGCCVTHTKQLRVANEMHNI